MFKDLNGQAIKNFQLAILKKKVDSDALLNTHIHLAWRFIYKNHQYNTLLWNEEDLARRTNVSDNEIVKNKRNIDKYNQKRNDYIEKIDEAIITCIPPSHKFKDNAWINSETIGSIIDRISINVLRIFHMKKQTKRKGISPSTKTECKAKLKTLNYQEFHLCTCLDELLTAIKQGKAIFKIYKQFKMYNDPNLNPYLYNFHKEHA